MTKPNLELLKLRKHRRQLRMLLEKQRKMLLPGNRELWKPKKKLLKRWPKTRKKPSREKPN